MKMGVTQPSAKTACFISYSHEDRDAVERIARQLHNRNDIFVWYDDWELRGGDRLRDRLQAAIASSSAFVLMLSQNSVHSKWVKDEIDEAFAHDIRVIPVRLDDCNLPFSVTGRLYVDFAVDDFHSSFERLVSYILGAPRRPIKALRMWLLPHGNTHITVLTGSTLLDGTLAWSKAAGSKVAEIKIFNAMVALGLPDGQIDVNYVRSANWDLIPRNETLYAVGGAKVNPVVGLCLRSYRREHGNEEWFFVRDHTYGYLGVVASDGTRLPPTIERARGLGDGYDYGLILWLPMGAPRPDGKTHNGLTCCLAGCHTGATATAAIAATDIDFIEKRLIRGSGTVQDAVRSLDRGVWALFRVTTEQFNPIRESIELLEAGTCIPK